VAYLVQKNADVNAKDDQAMAPLHYAAIHNVSMATIQELLQGLTVDAIRVLIDQQDKQGNTALHYAIWRKNAELVLFFLTYRASIDRTNKAGQSAIDLVALAPASIKKAIEMRKKELDVDGCCCGCLGCLWSCLCCS
jgi:ankyrin repeat protein